MNNNIYRIAIVPKIHWSIEYSRAYASQHDLLHIKLCLKKIINPHKIDYSIMYEERFFRTYTKYNGVIFIGISSKTKKFLKINDLNIDLFTWSFLQLEWIHDIDLIKKFKIIFEQSSLDISRYNFFKNKTYYTPLGFQSDRKSNFKSIPKYDIVFNGTLDRSRRQTQKNHRVDIIEKLLKEGVKILVYNGRLKYEKKLVEPLLKYKNFKIKSKWGNPNEYLRGVYSLNIPFHEFGAQINYDWGIDLDKRENSVFLIHWDTLRCLGSKSNMITFDCEEHRKLGLNEENCSFYKNDTRNLDGIVNEIFNIVDYGKKKKIDDNTWQKNSYLSRWRFIFSKIEEIINK